MNYYGKTILLIVSTKEICKVLQQAMGQVKKDRLFRGPDNLKSGNF